MSTHIIAFVGEIGSGKGEAIKIIQNYLQNKKVVVGKFSSALRDTLDLFGIPQTRENLQDLAIILKKQYGDGVITHPVIEVAKNAIKNGVDYVLIDGMRWLEDEKGVRSLPQAKIVYTTASPQQRFERMRLRNENAGESGLTWSEFERDSQKLNEMFISQIGSRADLTIHNDTTLESLKDKIKSFLDADNM